MGGDVASGDRHRPQTPLLGTFLAVAVAIVPGLLTGLGTAAVVDTATDAADLIIGAVGFVVGWASWAFLVRVCFALLNLERLTRDRL